MAYEVLMPYHLHMPSYFLGTFTEYPFQGYLHFADTPYTNRQSSVIFLSIYREFPSTTLLPYSVRAVQEEQQAFPLFSFPSAWLST